MGSSSPSKNNKIFQDKIKTTLTFRYFVISRIWLYTKLRLSIIRSLLFQLSHQSGLLPGDGSSFMQCSSDLLFRHLAGNGPDRINETRL